MGISASLSSLRGRTLFFGARCMQSFPFQLHLCESLALEHGGAWRAGAGAVRLGSGHSRQAAAPGDARRKRAAPGVCSEESG